jgi:multiple sugar transport system permease protein
MNQSKIESTPWWSRLFVPHHAPAYQRKEAIVGWLMASPAIILITMFLIIPFFMAFGFAFTNQRLISPNPTEFVGTRNFENLLTIRTFSLDPLRDEETNKLVYDEDGQIAYPSLRDFTRNNPEYPELNGLREWFSWSIGETKHYLLASDVLFMKALTNTLLFVLVVSPVQGGLALVLAVLINQKLRGINVFRTIYFMPVVTSMIVVSFLWRFIYDGNNGMLNTVLSSITFGAFQPVDWLGQASTALWAILAMSVWQGVGFHMVIWLAGLQNIPGTLYEAASIDGASNWQQFRYITWPGLKSTAIFVLVIITMQAFSLYPQIQAMTRGGPLDSTQSIVFQTVIRGYEKQDIAGGSAISVVLFFLVLSITLIQRYLTREKK